MELDEREELKAPEGAHFGTDEMNAAEFPIAVLSERAPRGVTTLERFDTAWDITRKAFVPRKVLITGAEKFGLPCAADNDVHIALITLTKRANDFRERSVKFSRGEIARELGWSLNGRTYRRIKLALHRLAGVRIVWENAWWDNAEKRHVTVDAGVLDGFELYERYANGELVDSDERQSTFVWSEFLFKSFEANYVKPINMDVYRRLELPVARQSYRLLDKRFHLENQCRFSLRAFADKIGLTNYRYESKIKEVLAPSLKALETQGVIREGRRYEQGDRRGEHTILFEQGAYERRKGKALVAHSAKRISVSDLGIDRQGLASGQGEALQDDLSPLVSELTKRGVSRGRAQSILKKKRSEHGHWSSLAWSIIESHDEWLRAHQGEKRNPAGRLVRSLECADTVPVGFVPRVQKLAFEDGRQRQLQRKALAEERQQEHEWQAASQALDRLLGSLSDAERENAVEEAWHNATLHEQAYRYKETSSAKAIEQAVLLRHFGALLSLASGRSQAVPGPQDGSSPAA